MSLKEPERDSEILARLRTVAGRASDTDSCGIRTHHGNRARTIILLAIFAGLGWSYVAYRRSEDEQVQRNTAASDTKQKEITEHISQFAERYDAVTDWRRNLGTKKLTDTIYSAELSRVFVSDTGKPVLFIGWVKDVSQQGENYAISFEGKINIHTNFLLRLACTPDQANLVLSQPRRERNRFAIVARVQSVESTGEEMRQGEDGSSYRQAVSHIEGQCVDVMFIGPYSGDYREVLSTFQK